MFIYTLTLITCTSILGFLLYSLLHSRRRKDPLRQLPPGPRPWPIFGNLLQLGPKPHKSLAELARVHGPLMHLKLGALHAVVASSASVAEQFLKVHDSNFLSRPPNSAAKYFAYNYQDMVFTSYGPRWRLLRKICALHLFSAKALDNFVNVRQEEVRVLSGALARAIQTPVDLGQMINTCTTNAISRVILGRSVVGHGHGRGDTEAEEVKALVAEVTVLAGMFVIGDFIPWFKGLDIQGVVKKLKVGHTRFDSFLNAMIEDHKNDGTRGREGHVDLLSTLISSEVEDDGTTEERLTPTEIKALLLVMKKSCGLLVTIGSTNLYDIMPDRNLFIAGTDTTSTTVCWSIAELIHHQDILTQAQQELDSVVGKERFVAESDLPHLTFLQAVVKETFRLHPSTPLSLPRIANESCEINGYFIPKGATLLVNVWAIGRDPDVWAEPLEFRPQRFMPGGERPNVDVRGTDFEAIPFGAGRRICAGVGLGIRMVQLLTATLIHAFDFGLVDGQLPETLNMEEAFALTLGRSEPLMVHPKPRLASRVYEAHM